MPTSGRFCADIVDIGDFVPSLPTFLQFCADIADILVYCVFIVCCEISSVYSRANNSRSSPRTLLGMHNSVPKLIESCATSVPEVGPGVIWNHLVQLPRQAEPW